MMFELNNLTAALTALGSLVGLANKVGTVEFNQKLIEVQQGLMATQVDFLKLLEENRELKSEIEQAHRFDFHHSVSWKKSEDGSEVGPYCPICLAEGTEMPLACRGKHASNSALVLFSCPKGHAPQGEPRLGLRPVLYSVPKALLKPDRYVIA